jgi:hypothetical protein
LYLVSRKLADLEPAATLAELVQHFLGHSRFLSLLPPLVPEWGLLALALP